MIFPGTPGRFSDCNHALCSNVGKGPKGDGIIADVVRDDPYGVYRVQFKNSRTGEVYLTTPNMDPGSRIYFCSLTLQYQSSEDEDVSYTVPLRAFSTQQVGTIRDARVGDMVFYKLRREGMLGANAIGIGIITNLSLDDNVTFMQHSVLDIENIDEIDAQVQALQETADTIQDTLDALPSYEEFTTLQEKVNSFGVPEYLLETFEGNTLEDKLFNALDTLEFGRIVCGAKITFTRGYVKNDTTDGRFITIEGAVLDISNLNDGLFSIGNDGGHILYNLMNCTIIGNYNYLYGSGTHIVCGLINNCTFYRCGLYNDSNNYLQSPDMVSCEFVSVNNFITASNILNGNFNSCKVESGNGIFIKATSLTVLTITDCLIEGRQDYTIEYSGTQMLSISGCYFEANKKSLVHQLSSGTNNFVKYYNNAWFNGNIETSPQYILLLEGTQRTNVYISNNYNQFGNNGTDEPSSVCNFRYPSIYQVVDSRNSKLDYRPRSAGGNFFNEILGYNNITGAYANNKWTFSKQLYENIKYVSPMICTFYGSTSATSSGYVVFLLSPKVINAATVVSEITVLDADNSNTATKSFSGDVTATIELVDRLLELPLLNIEVSGFTSTQGTLSICMPQNIINRTYVGV